MRLAQELTFLTLLPAALEARFASQGGSSPPLVIVYLSSLKVRNGAGVSSGFLAEKGVSRRGVWFRSQAIN